MEGKKFEVVSSQDIACSFEPILHREYEAIRAECDPWLLALVEPTSGAAAEFWVDCVFPWSFCLAYAGCRAERVLHITKILTWLSVFDSEEDDPALSGCDGSVGRRRHELILACFGGNLPVHHGIDDPRTVKQMEALHEVVQSMLENMSPRLQARMLDALRDYLNAISIQGHYRSYHHLPELDEYITMRRSDSLMHLAFQLMEYGLGMELDEETLKSQLFVGLQDTAVDHVAFTNDVVSCHVEIYSNDLMNLPSVILFNTAGATLEEAMQRALSMVAEVDERCVRLMAEMQKSSLIHKPGVEAYVRGLQMWMAGNKVWSLKTARFKRKLSHADPGVVLDIGA